MDRGRGGRENKRREEGAVLYSSDCVSCVALRCGVMNRKGAIR